jgi:hypothetical protein
MMPDGTWHNVVIHETHWVTSADELEQRLYVFRSGNFAELRIPLYPVDRTYEDPSYGRYRWCGAQAMGIAFGIKQDGDEVVN